LKQEIIDILKYYSVALRIRPEPGFRANGNYKRWRRIQPVNTKEAFCSMKLRLTIIECIHCFVNEYTYNSVMFSMKAEDD
jgi:hypothetical protein